MFRKLTDRGPVQLSARQTIWWWEKRRPIYNLLVLTAGVLSIGGAVAGSEITDSSCGIPDPPIFACFAILAYGIAANALYTIGWLSELLLRNNLKEPNRYAKTTFVAGVVFSVVVTLIPGLLLLLLCVLTGGSGSSDSGATY